MTLLKEISVSDLSNELLTSEKYQTLLRSFFANIHDLESKKFNGYKLHSKRGTYYEKVTKIDDEGNRSKEFIAKGINMPSLYKYAKTFAGILAEVIEISFDRCSNESKQYASRCLMFGNHIVNLVTGDEQSISELVKNLKKIIAFTLASEPELRTRNLKVTSANDIVTHINEQLTKLLFSLFHFE